MCARCCRVLLPLLFVLLFATACAQPLATSSDGVQAASLHPVAVQGGELEYRARGRGEPVLLIHGSVLADVFAPMLNDPALRDYRLILYNRRGYAGSTRAPRSFTIEQQAADAIAVLDRVGAGRAHIIGQSYGGAIALELARRYPHRVATLVLMEAAVPALDEPDPQFMQAVMEAVGSYQQGEVRAALYRFANAVTPGGWDALPSAMQEQALADASTFFEVELPAMQQWPYTIDDARALSFPTLVMYGSESPAMFRRSSRALADAIPHAQTKEIFGAGHELQMKQPHAVAEALRIFLSEHRID